MTAAWVWVAGALALVPLGSSGAMRLEVLSGVDKPGWTPTCRLGHTGAAVTGAAMVVAVVWLGGALLGAAAALALLTVGRLLGRARAGRAARQAATAALDVVRLVQAEVVAGAPAPDAVAAGTVLAGPFDADLVLLADALRDARDPTVGIAVELRPMAQALRVSATSGATLAEVLEVVADQLQAGLDRAAAVTAALAGARSSAALLALLPVVGLVLGAALGADPVRVLFATSGGHVLVFTGVVLECLGLVWTSRLAASAECA